MSGWNPGALFELVYGLFTIMLGGLFLVEHVLAARAYDRQLHNGNGGTDPGRRPTGLLWSGLIFIIIGTTNLLFPPSRPHEWPWMVAFGCLLLAVGIVWPFVEAVRRRRQKPGTTARPRQLAYILISLLFGGAMLTLGLIEARS